MTSPATPPHPSSPPPPSSTVPPVMARYIRGWRAWTPTASVPPSPSFSPARTGPTCPYHLVGCHRVLHPTTSPSPTRAARPLASRGMRKGMSMHTMGMWASEMSMQIRVILTSSCGRSGAAISSTPTISFATLSFIF